MEILGLIPARAGSKGIPGKNLKRLAGRPLVEYTFQAALRSRCLSRVILSTDDSRIAALGRQNGIEVPFLRPKKLAGDQAPASAYVAHALRELRRRENYEPDAVMILQPTSPFRTAQDMDHCARLLTRLKADAVVSVVPAPAAFHPEWQCRIENGRLCLFDGRPWRKIRTRRQALSPTFIRNGAVYLFWSKTFLRYGHIYGQKIRPYLMPARRSINIDGRDDWALAEKIIQGKAR